MSILRFLSLFRKPEAPVAREVGELHERLAAELADRNKAEADFRAAWAERHAGNVLEAEHLAAYLKSILKRGTISIVDRISPDVGSLVELKVDHPSGYHWYCLFPRSEDALKRIADGVNAMMKYEATYPNSTSHCGITVTLSDQGASYTTSGGGGCFVSTDTGGQLTPHIDQAIQDTEQLLQAKNDEIARPRKRSTKPATKKGKRK